MKTLIATISVCLLITCAQAQGSLQSPRLVRLAREIATAGPEAINTFREEVQKQGTPLIEPIAEDPAHFWVTFLWFAKEPVRNVVVFSGLTNYAYTRAVLPDIQMVRLDGTDVWFKTFKVRKDARFAYQLSVNDSLVPEEDEADDGARRARLISDPLNPHHVGDALGKTSNQESLVELPGAPAQVWIRRSGKPAGQLKSHQLRSEILKNERDVTVYFPPGYNARRRAYPLLIVFDGDAYTDDIPTPTILDNLIAARKIPPVVAVFVNKEARLREHVSEDFGMVQGSACCSKCSTARSTDNRRRRRPRNVV
ncbi:MAG TPA: enterochelin esterase domain-containing protein, partial [Pyrinomonadaceae bacterium]|nr:enterochelin esterase domain-containing protein [Pyrinomonadaceae bacterium]